MDPMEGRPNVDTCPTRSTCQNRRAHVLWNKVLKTRSALTAQRHLPIRDSSVARAELLSALEAYAASLTDHGRPIPYALRDERASGGSHAQLT